VVAVVPVCVLPPATIEAVCGPPPPAPYTPVIIGAALDHASLTNTVLKVSLVVLYQTCPSATDSLGSVVTA